MSYDRSVMRDDAIRNFTGQLRARGHVPLRQGHVWECYRCGWSAQLVERPHGYELMGQMTAEARCGT